MPHKFLRLLLAATFFLAKSIIPAQTMRGLLYDYLDNYTRAEQELKRAKLDSLNINDENNTVSVVIGGGFSDQFFNFDIVNGIYSSVRSFMPDSLSDYRLEIKTMGRRIEDLVPNAMREEKDARRMWSNTYSGQPWVKNASSPLTITEGLANHHLALWQSHGIYWKAEKNAWMWQRPHLFCTTEDLFTQTFVVPYLIPMLENAGAVVYTPRERDWQNREIIVDNDAPEKDGRYEESGRWQVCDSAGFAHLKNIYYATDKPFRDGTVRQCRTTISGEQPGKAIWTPTIAEDGEYAVYVAYQTLEKSIDDARYTVVHCGMETNFQVNQQMGGSTWVYLGTFRFEAGRPERNRVVLTNESRNDGIVTADAVRFGGGMGNIAKGYEEDIDGEEENAPTSLTFRRTSRMPRWAEAARYFEQWAGMPDTVFNHTQSDNDYNNDMWARVASVNLLAGGSPYLPQWQNGRRVPLEMTLAVHSDAGYSREEKLTGTLSICSADFYHGLTNSGMSRMASYDLASMLLQNLHSDLRKHNWRVRQIWNKNYCETREPQVPSVILEMLSHQNFYDLRLAYDPQFKFDFCRSVYKTLVRYIATQHQQPYTIQPLPVHNFAITLNDQGGWANLTWDATTDSIEPTAQPTRYVLYTRIDDGDFDNGRIIDATSCIVPLERDRIYSFRVCAVNAGGRSFPSETLSVCSASDNHGTVLIVNAFTRLEGPAWIDTPTEQGFLLDDDPGVQYGKFAGFCGRQLTFDTANMGSEEKDGTGYSGSELEGRVLMGNTFDYVSLHGQGIRKTKRHSFVSCSEEALLTKVVIPDEYAMIDVIFGTQKRFNNATLQLLETYCAHGGRLLVSGANILAPGFSLPALHAAAGDIISDKAVENVNGSSLDFTIWRQLNEQSYPVPAVRSLSPTDAAAFTMLQYTIPAAEPEEENEENAAGQDTQSPTPSVRFAGAGIAYNGDRHKAVTLGFPVESIRQPEQRDLLMQAVTNFLLEQ